MTRRQGKAPSLTAWHRYAARERRDARESPPVALVRVVLLRPIMRSLLLRVLVIGVFGLASCFVLWTFRAPRLDGAARVAGWKEKADLECAAYRAEPLHAEELVCAEDAFAPMTFRVFEAADGALLDARAALARGDAASATRALEEMTKHAVHLRRRGTSGAIFAADLVDRLAPVVGSDAIERSVRRAALEALTMDAASAPFVGWRIHRQWELAHMLDTPALKGPSLSAGEIAEGLDQQHAQLHAMERAMREDNVPECQRAAERIDERFRGPSARLCELIAKVRHAEHARVAALAAL